MVEMFDTFPYDEEQTLRELADLIAIPSVSADPARASELHRACAWLTKYMEGIGFPRVEVWPTTGHPLAYGEWLVDPDLPTVLIYGHYDVQPEDPIDKWTEPPFSLSLRDGNLYARGITDNKGHLFAALKALQALVAESGRPPVNVKCLFEGEEEIGSPSLEAAWRSHAADLQADLVISVDGAMWGVDQPSITLGGKGIAGLQVELRGAVSDLPSGSFGVVAPNAARDLARVLASLHDDQGRIAVPGFYDDVRDPTPEERRLYARVPFDETAFKQRWGLRGLFGEPEFTAVERRFARPSIDINGMWSGYQGPGRKTVVPSRAWGKLTFRLVPDQRPERVVAAVARHLEQQTPPWATITVTPDDGNIEPTRMSDPEHPYIRAAAEVLKEAFGRDPVYVRSGGSLPVAGIARRMIDVPFLQFAFGTADANVHAPDEYLPLRSFRRGIRSFYKLLRRLPEVGRQG